MIKDLETQMKAAAKDLEFEQAAIFRDQIVELRRTLSLYDEEKIARAGEKLSRPKLR